MYFRLASQKLMKRKYTYNSAINTQNRTYTEFILAYMAPEIYQQFILKLHGELLICLNTELR